MRGCLLQLIPFYLNYLALAFFSLQFHLANSVAVSAVQAAKILGNKKATLVCKDAAQAIWTSEVLATSVRGHLPPAKRSSGVLPKGPLTPLKVDVVAGKQR